MVHPLGLDDECLDEGEGNCEGGVFGMGELKWGGDREIFLITSLYLWGEVVLMFPSGKDLLL